MGMFDDLLAKAKHVADRNGDGKIDAADLEGLKDSVGEEGKAKLSQAQQVADRNGDGKIDFEDLKMVLSGAQQGAGDLAHKAGDAAKGAGEAVGGVFNDVKGKLFK